MFNQTIRIAEAIYGELIAKNSKEIFRCSIFYIDIF